MKIKLYKYFTLLILVSACSSSDDNVAPATDPCNQPIVAIPFSGEINWTKTYGGDLNDEAKSIITTPDGGYAIAGSSESLNGDLNGSNQSGTYDYWLMKLDANGNMEWNKTYGGSGDDQAEEVISTPDGGYLISGFSKSNDGDISGNNGFYDHWLVKTDTSGNLEWEKSYGYAGEDRAFSVIVTNDGGYLTAGSLSVEEYKGPNQISKSAKFLQALHGVGEFWVHKLNVKGEVEWEKFFGGSNNDRAYDVIETNDGYLMVGATESNDFDIKNKAASSYDVWVVKINKEGVLQWEKSYGGSESDIGFAIAKTNDGNFIITGDTRSGDGFLNCEFGNADALVLKIDPSGNLLWAANFGGSNYDTAQDILVASDGNYIISGTSKSNDKNVSTNNGKDDVWIFKINDKAKMLWNVSLGADQMDLGMGLTENIKNEIVVVGVSENSETTTSNQNKNAYIVNLK